MTLVVVETQLCEVRINGLPAWCLLKRRAHLTKLFQLNKSGSVQEAHGLMSMSQTLVVRIEEEALLMQRGLDQCLALGIRM